jgi:hypothetical protein
MVTTEPPAIKPPLGEMDVIVGASGPDGIVSQGFGSGVNVGSAALASVSVGA